MNSPTNPEVSKSAAALLRPPKLGALSLPNRFVMAPMTRGRSQPDATPVPMMADYYRARAGAGLIVTEATAISPTAVGWLGAPGIWSAAHVAGWRVVTDAVHADRGRIFLQLWHTGRTSHPDFLGGAQPVGPSAIAAKGQSHTPLGKKPYVVPRELAIAEIRAIVADYGAATKRAREAGFDGVELHGANGYLVDEFLRDGSNQRTDDYGGSVAKRLRFLGEIVDAMAGAWSADRVGVRLSPVGTYNDMADSDPRTLFVGAAELLKQKKIAYLHVVEGLPGSAMFAPHPERISPLMKSAFGGTVGGGGAGNTGGASGAFIVNGGYDAAKAAAAIDAGEADLVAFGVPFLANPDYIERVKRGAPLNKPDFATLYTPGAKGYLDYPTMAQVS